MQRMPQPRPPARRSSRAHEAIIAAAIDLAGRRGYGGAGIEAIAAAAGVGKQTIYRWWPNKAALFIEVYGRLAPAGLLAEDTGSLEGDLRALLARLSHLYVDTPAGAVLSGLVADAQAAPEIARQLRETYVVPRRSIVVGILHRAEARGEVAAGCDAGFASDLFSGAVWFRLLLGEPRLDGRFADQLIGALLHGVARPAAPAGEGPDAAKRP